jgi:hypothetical protein
VPGGSKNNDGAFQLLNSGTEFSNVKSTYMHTASNYHDMSNADPTNTSNTPEISTRSDAQDDAERLNTHLQFFTGMKKALLYV